ncbi:glycoside hydrolase family 3 N-terminal domain-containing protein [Streptomyces erythrochromogenes]|uniref:glycoside hydrolase family 3 N-terminal domain-containing protein n=1 Tax=Streptomyces erythrochromogenes TaxID=285574 RepID=UPI00343DB04B
MMPPQLDLEVVREQVESLVRPGRVPSGAGGWLRIGKDLAHSPALMKAATGSVAAGAGRVLLSVNQEGGRLSALDWPEAVQLPGAAALGAAGSPELAEQAGAAIGGQLRAVGLTWNLAPVCDLATVVNSAVSGRAFSDQPAVAARLAAAFVRGLQGAGVAGTAKHFPGLGGAAADPHLQTPVLDRLLRGALAPFEAAVEAGVASVMVGSHIVRDLDTVPALASAQVVGLLRDRIGFEGVIVSENLSIPAVCNPLGGLATAALAAVTAGVDMVMLDSEISRGHHGAVPGTGARRRSAVVDALIDAVLGGRLDPAQVARSAARIAAMEGQFGLAPAAVLPAWGQANETAEQVAEAIAAAAVRVPCGGHLLPLDLHGRSVALLRVPDAGERKADSARHAPDLLPSLVGEHFPVGSLPLGGRIPADAGAAVVYGYDTGRGPDGFSLAAACATGLAGRGVPVVQIALGDADELTGSRADVLIAAWSPHRATAAAVASLLTGRTAAPVLPAERSRP